MYRQMDLHAEFKTVIYIKKSNKTLKNTILRYFF